MMKTRVFAHRGASVKYPENTLDAFRQAMADGADGLELDVHLSKDGEAVVIHDLALERTTDGTGRVCDMTLDGLQQLNAAKPIPGSAPCYIPTLAEVYAITERYDIVINVELKTLEQQYPQMPKKLIDLARAYRMENRIIYSSFNHYSLLALRELDKSVKIGLLYAMGLVDPWVYAKHLKADYIHPHYHVLLALPETVHACREAGIGVNAWTADDPADISYLLKIGVDGIITNKPDVAVEQFR